MLGSFTGLLGGSPDGQDPLLPVDGLPEALGDLSILQLLEDLLERHVFYIAVHFVL